MLEVFTDKYYEEFSFSLSFVINNELLWDVFNTMEHILRHWNHFIASHFKNLVDIAGFLTSTGLFLSLILISFRNKI